jgi:hypothetical protein
MFGKIIMKFNTGKILIPSVGGPVKRLESKDAQQMFAFSNFNVIFVVVGGGPASLNLSSDDCRC